MAHASSGPMTIRLIGGPTALIEIAGLRLLTDPTFDEPRTYEDLGFPVVAKLRGPALSPQEIGPVDAVLLSHDEHPDNLDVAGRAYLASVPRIVTTAAGAQRLGGTAHGLAPYEETGLSLPGGGTLRVTALPAQHGPEGSEAVSGPVIGFLLTAAGAPVTYVSGDNASVDVVAGIAGKVGSPEVSVLFTGGASVPFRFGGDYVTLPAAAAAQAAGILGSGVVVPVHLNGWSHYTDTEADVIAAFRDAGREDVLRVLEPGAAITATGPAAL
jgi:L-ascorbate metabolism protein UlaG (beta-lactamase superfamily)